MNWLRNMPRLRFNCLLIYYTASGYRRQSHHRTIASSADLALDIAEKQLRNDKRRRVDRVVYGRAIRA